MELKIFGIHHNDSLAYQIEIKSGDVYIPINRDKDIAEILKLELKSYQKILQHFNGKKDALGTRHIFSNVEDARKALDHLNDKYGVLLKLMG